MPDINKAVNEMVRICNNNKHGYSMINRTGNPDYDCSSLVIHCLDYAGFKMSKYGASYTGNMVNPLRKCGFTNIIQSINLKTGKGLKKCDILLNEKHHTAMMISSTKMAAAHWNYDGKKGDSSGKEICISNYANYSKGWTSIWRYETAKTNASIIIGSKYDVAFDCILGKYGNGDLRRKNLEKEGYDYAEIQNLINHILSYREIVKKVMKGDYGNGAERIRLLTTAGYDYDIVQGIINTIMSGGYENYEYYFRN